MIPTLARSVCAILTVVIYVLRMEAAMNALHRVIVVVIHKAHAHVTQDVHVIVINIYKL